MINNLDSILPLLNFDSEHDFYIVQIIKRRKENPDLHVTSTCLLEKYVMSKDYLISRMPGWIAYATAENARIYINPNKRRMDNMALQCNLKLAKYLIAKQYDAVPVLFQKTIGAHNDENPKRWIIDIDDDPTSDEVLEIKRKINELHEEAGNGYKIEAFITTNSGYHFISNPFNSKKFKDAFPDVTLHKNSPTLLFMP